MPRKLSATACRQSSTRETKAQRFARLAARRADQRSRTADTSLRHDFDPTKNGRLISKRKFQQFGGKGSSKLGQERNPRSAEVCAEAAAPFHADHERIAALGIDPKYLNANAAICQGKKPLVRKVAGLAWRKAAKAWDDARKREAAKLAA